MQAFLHQLLSGLANGALYASIALALVMIFKATHHVNFAQGELAMFSTFVALWMINAGVPYWIAFLLTLGFSFVAGVAIERLIMRQFHDKPVLAAVIVFIGLLIFINGLAGLVFGLTQKGFPSPFASEAWYGTKYLTPHQVGMVAVTLRSSGSPGWAWPCGRPPRTRSRAVWSGSASAGCSRSAGAWPACSGRSRAR